MATMTATNYSEQPDHQKDGQYDGDELSTTLTMQSGYSSEYRPNTLPMSRLSRYTVKLRACSSFPNLLSLYQYPIQEESYKEEIPKKKKVQKRERRNKQTQHRPDWEEQHDRRARHEMRQIRIDVVAKEQIDKFDKYVSSMTGKVEKQREERRKYNEVLQERLHEQEEAEKRKLRLHRGPKHVYVHNRQYLKTLPVSNYCKATRLADDLQRKGVLRTRCDVEKYWNGFASQQRKGNDIFSDTSATSVNYPLQWIGVKKPEIKIIIDEEEEHLTDAVGLQLHRQLPPLQKKKKKRKNTPRNIN